MRALEAGDEIADDRIEALAGRAGMGVVYRARQRRPDYGWKRGVDPSSEFPNVCQ